MTSFKRLISFVAVIALVLVSFPYMRGFAAETVALEKVDAAAFIESLGIVTDKTDALYGQNVTRADFAEYLARLLKIGYTQPAEEQGRYFVDVADYDYAVGSIDALVEAGIISVGESRKFRPADYITLNEAVKMAVCAVGFRPMAESRGGFPNGYIKVAKQQGVLNGVNKNGGYITLNDATRLLFNTLITPMYTVSSVTTDFDGEYGLVYSANGDKTLLEDIYSMKCVRGVLTGADGIDIWQGGASSETSVMLGRNVYRAEKASDYVEFIGREVYGIYDTKLNSIFCIFRPFDGKENTTEIDIKDFVSYSKDKVSYYKDGGNKVVEADVSGALLIYNGAVPKRNIEDLIKGLTDGSVSLIDYDNDNKYDAVMIENFESYVVKYYDSVTKSLLFKNNSSCIDFDDFEYTTIIDKNGKYVSADELNPNDIISISKTENGERIKIVVGGSTVEGVIGGKRSTGGKTFCKIGDELYEVSSEFLKKFENSMNGGKYVTGYIDMFGKLIYMEIKEESDYNSAYLMDVAFNADGLDKYAKFYVFTDNSKLETLSSAKNITIDGVRYRNNDEKALKAIPECSVSGNEATVIPQIIRYKLNLNGEISRIDTYNQGNEAEEASLKRVLDQSKDTMKFNYRIGKNLVLSDNTKVYHVPLDEELLSAERMIFL